MDWRGIRCRQCSQVYAGCHCWNLSDVEARQPNRGLAILLEMNRQRAIQHERAGSLERRRAEALDKALAKVRETA